MFLKKKKNATKSIISGGVMLPKKKKNAITGRCFIVSGVLITMLFSISRSQLTTEDLLSNAGFNQKDGIGYPIDWKVKIKDDDQANVVVDIVENDTKEGAGALRIIVKELLTKDVFVEQSLLPGSAMAGQTLYCRSWAKVSTNVGYFFQIPIRMGNVLPGPPWWESGPFVDIGTPSQPGVWEQSEKEIECSANMSAFLCAVWLSKNIMPGCTLWVDNIELSTEPTSINKHITTNVRTDMFSVHGKQVSFHSPTNYQVRIYTPNGKQYDVRSGYGQSVTLSDLPAGYYILNMQLGSDKVIHPFVVSNR